MDCLKFRILNDLKTFKYIYIYRYVMRNVINIKVFRKLLQIRLGDESYNDS